MSNDFDKQLEELEHLASLMSEETGEVIEEKSDDFETEEVEDVVDAEASEEVVAEDAEEVAEDAEEVADAEDTDDTNEDSTEDDETEEKSVEEVSEVEEKAQKIMSMMKKPKKEEPSVFMTDIRFKEMEENGELLNDDQYEELDDEAKSMYERVSVVDEETKAGMGMRWRLREMMKSEDSDTEEKAMHEGKKGERSIFLTDIRFKKMMDSGELMDEEAYSKLSDDEKSNCMKVDVYNEKTKKGMGKYWRRRMPMEREQEVKKNSEKSLDEVTETKTEESYLCGFQRKSVDAPCSFCRGGCAPEDGLPGLSDIEDQVKSAYEGSEIIGSGYSDSDDMYIVDVKQADGSVIEVFLSGEGKTLGWLAVDPELVEESEGVDIISEKDAIAAALDAVPGDAVSVMVDVFEDYEVFNIEVDGADAKSYDVYVSVKGEVLAYDVYEVDGDAYEMSEEEEIKALEAELEIKRMYSREQREDMAERGEALPDGSYPIADKADLQNAIQAYGRAKDKEAAKAHIIKRAKELDAEDMIPENWMDGEKPEESEEEGEKDLDAGMAEALAEYNRLLAEIEGE